MSTTRKPSHPLRGGSTHAPVFSFGCHVSKPGKSSASYAQILIKRQSISLATYIKFLSMFFAKFRYKLEFLSILNFWGIWQFIRWPRATVKIRHYRPPSKMYWCGYFVVRNTVKYTKVYGQSQLRLGTVTDSISTHDAIRRIRIFPLKIDGNAIVLYKCLRADPQMGTVTDSR